MLQLNPILTTMRAMNAFQNKRLNMLIKTNALTTTTAMNAFQKGLNMHIKPMLTFQ